MEPSATSARESLQHATEHLFERNSVIRDHELLTEALRHGRGQVNLKELQGEFELERSKGAYVQRGNQLTTADALRREQSIVAAVNRGMGHYDRLGGSHEFQPEQYLRDEQKHAVKHVLDSQDFAINLRGAAGTGKTATLKEIHRGLLEAGHEVTAVAPTRSAVEELEKVGFRNAMTIARLQEDETAQLGLHRGVLIVDEAGMVSGRQMESLLRIAEENGARILFSGDTRQIQSVEASDALRILERESRMKSVSLTGVQRQTNSEYREAIQTLRESPEKGFEKLERLGAVHEVPFNDRAQTVANLYRTMTADPSRRVLVVAPTHEEIRRISEAIRSDRKERGELGAGQMIERHVPLQWTEAQKRDLSNYREGQVLHVHRAGREMEKHEALTVNRIEEGLLIARNSSSEERTFTPAQTRSVSVHELQSFEIAPGDRLLLTGNRREPNFRATNGELVTVRQVDGSSIQLEDGRTLPANYREFDYGYAVTAHRSQGKTVDSVILSADTMKQELFYVGASRGRSEIAIVTSDGEQLRESLGISSARTSALELAGASEHAQAPAPDALMIPAQANGLPVKIPEIEIAIDHSLGL